jgi:hypothetical protein
MVTAWSKCSSALRTCATITSPTVACSVGPGIDGGPSGFAKPALNS